MRTPLIAGNWKMHKTLPDARELVQGIREGVEDHTAGDGAAGVDVLICPPVQLLFPMAKAVAGSPVMLGAQNVHEEPQGAFTGEVSVPMLRETGCTHVIVGHSERRHIFGEGGQRLARKVRAVVGGGLTAIYCVGETLAEREAGQTRLVVERQMNEVINRDVVADRLVIAYEPVWAIGTGKTATPDEAQEVHALIRNLLGETYDASVADSTRILYGGSVKPANAAGLLAQRDIDGALVGGACLVAGDFLAIIAAASCGSPASC
ncbi:MAG: triose-phosphate isomerase [Phycisphaerae bacterium]